MRTSACAVRHCSEVNYRPLSEALSRQGMHVDRDWFLDRIGLSSPDLARAAAERTGMTLDVPQVVADRNAAYLRHVFEVREIPVIGGSCGGRVHAVPSPW
jgi:hypothetical protein